MKHNVPLEDPDSLEPDSLLLLHPPPEKSLAGLAGTTTRAKFPLEPQLLTLPFGIVNGRPEA